MKVSTLGYAVLGLLAGEAMSGYDLKLRMGDPVGFFWQASHSQIYPELAKLEGAGMVSHRVVAQEGKQDKKVYEISTSGREAVEDWVASPPKAGLTRDETTLRAYLSWLGGANEMAGFFRERARSHQDQLERYRETEARIHRGWGEDPLAMEPQQFASYAALKRGIGYEQEYARWCRWVSETLEARAEQGSEK
ncbi:MAG: PadR family transcriptional regulator [Rubrobacter sp.]